MAVLKVVLAWLHHAGVFFRRGLWGQFDPTEIGIAPAGIDITLLKGPLILIPGRTM